MSANLVPPHMSPHTPSNRSSIDETHTHHEEKIEKSTEDLSNSLEPPVDLEKGPLEPIEPQTSNLVEFDGPHDPGNPKNWSARRRWGITVSMGLMVFTVTFASSIFSVNIGVVKEKFQVSEVTATLGVSLFVLVCSI